MNSKKLLTKEEVELIWKHYASGTSSVKNYLVVGQRGNGKSEAIERYKDMLIINNQKELKKRIQKFKDWVDSSIFILPEEAKIIKERLDHFLGEFK